MTTYRSRTYMSRDTYSRQVIWHSHIISNILLSGRNEKARWPDWRWLHLNTFSEALDGSCDVIQFLRSKHNFIYIFIFIKLYDRTVGLIFVLRLDSIQPLDYLPCNVRECVFILSWNQYFLIHYQLIWFVLIISILWLLCDNFLPIATFRDRK